MKKELFTFEVNKEIVKKVETKNGDDSITITNEKSIEPVKITLLVPSRRDKEEMSLVYNAKFSKCLALGIGTREMIRKAILDGGGGQHSKLDIERLDTLVKVLSEKLAKANDLSTEEEKAESQKEVDSIVEEIDQLENLYKGVFEHSAEYNATAEMISWCVLFLTKEGANDVFLGPTFDSKTKNYYDAEDEDNKFLVDVYYKSTVIYYCYLVKGISDKNDIESIFNLSK